MKQFPLYLVIPNFWKKRARSAKELSPSAKSSNVFLTTLDFMGSTSIVRNLGSFKYPYGALLGKIPFLSF
jgi:hypothetical protein